MGGYCCGRSSDGFSGGNVDSKPEIYILGASMGEEVGSPLGNSLGPGSVTVGCSGSSYYGI